AEVDDRGRAAVPANEIRRARHQPRRACELAKPGDAHAAAILAYKVRMLRRPLVLACCALALAAAPIAQSPKTHRLLATPETVAYGWYDAAGVPVLRIASGDIIDVDTLLTNTPMGLRNAGVAEDQIQQSLKDITDKVPREKRGPGGHIL